MVDYNPEIDPGRIETKAERSIPSEQDFEKNYAENGIPPFAGEQFGVARKENEFYGESKDDAESEKAA